jgi:hypothetical protein
MAMSDQLDAPTAFISGKENSVFIGKKTGQALVALWTWKLWKYPNSPRRNQIMAVQSTANQEINT